ncbi:MAG: PKD domain-containing protein, partial [Candidatus Latescibacterota bacterium]
MVFRLAIAVLAFSVFFIPIAPALERPDVEFKIFQFPPNMIPSIDGKTDDWNIVPESYAIGSDQLRDTDLGNVGSPDPKDLNVKVKVGWVKGMNRL